MAIKETVFHEVFDAQLVFRKMLWAISRPGEVVNLGEWKLTPPDGFCKTSALVAFSLLNEDVTFFMGTQGSEWIDEYLKANTGSKKATQNKADFVFLEVSRMTTEEAVDCIGSLKEGTDLYPEISAFLILQVKSISTNEIPSGVCLHLKGPGIEQTNKIYVEGVDPAIFQAIKVKNQEFPLGIETFFTAPNGAFFAIPRSCHFSWS